MSEFYEKRPLSYRTIQQGLKQQNWPVCRIIPQSDGQPATVSNAVESQKPSKNDDLKQVSSQQPG
ncbi:MAG: hypothetical protein CMK46_01765 [Porticoccus sp.]|jgi:hypothetical protein|nr:hypothetical protein [Porticoccus sp.]